MLLEKISYPDRQLPVIPDKLYFTISEVGKLCNLKPHVLRYWEQEFAQLKPKKRAGNRRFYSQKDIILIRRIKKLLYEKGYTINGARSFFANEDTADRVSCEHNLSEIIGITLTKLENLLEELQQDAGHLSN